MKADLLKDSLTQIFERDLKRLKKEIDLFKKEDNLWVIEKEINNSAGNLCLHICGNLRHYIGSVLGGSGYERDRESEFSTKHIPREKLQEEIDETIAAVKRTINVIPDNDFNRNYPVNVFNIKMNTGFFLFHLAAHLNYHLGQINYHRRLIE